MSHAVLIADDNLFIRQGLRELFGREDDFDVCGEAENGKEAVEKAQQLKPELIVLDFSMPVMNGMAAARILKRVMPGVPVIMYSAYDEPSAEQDARSAGVWAWVSKSEHISVLLGKARCALGPQELLGFQSLSVNDHRS
jgi:DNA-binding NarL/FixJ family response regulator